MPQGNLDWRIQLAITLLLTAAALIAGTATFFLVSAAEHSKCVARYSDRSLATVRQLCGRSL